jgi:GTPase SAR1 family protein
LATVGIDHVNKKYFSQKNNREVTIKMWDTAGQERFRNLTKVFYKKA